MSEFVNAASVQQYTTNVELLLQQRGSKFRGTVMTSNPRGKNAVVVEQIGPVAAVQRTSRHADTPLISTPHDKRWVAPKDYEWADLIDDQDKLRMLIDPQSSYAVNGGYAIGRAQDDELIAAFFGTAQTGENGTTATPLPAGQTIAVGGAGMTVTKLRQAKRMLMAAEVDVDNDPLYVAISARQHEDLLTETQAISLDYTNKPVLVDGKITAFMGFNFIHSERLPTTAGDRRCPAWAKSGMHLCLWNDLTTRISERADKGYSTQVYVKSTHGATRTEELKVIDIVCDEP